MPKSWTVELHDREEGSTVAGTDTALEIRSAAAGVTVAVEARRSLAPREVAYLFGSLGQRLRRLSPNAPVLVVAPWLSARTRELLAAEGANYIDLTGNGLLRLDSPALFIQTQGAERDPAPAPRGKARVRGPRAGRLIRTLVDVRPPYGVRELAEASGLAPGYDSRLLDALNDDALVERGRRGRVGSVDVAGLLRRWGESYEVFRSNDTAAFLARAVRNRRCRCSLAKLRRAGLQSPVPSPLYASPPSPRLGSSPSIVTTSTCSLRLSS